MEWQPRPKWGCYSIACESQGATGGESQDNRTLPHDHDHDHDDYGCYDDDDDDDDDGDNDDDEEEVMEQVSGNMSIGTVR